MDKETALKKLAFELEKLNQTKIGRRALLQAAPLLLASCASPQKTRYREGDNTGQNTSLSVRDEQKMTKEYLPKMRKDYPAVKNSKAQRYITELGNRIVTANNLRNKPYSYNFTLVNSKSINAFALPAGEVFVTVPLLKVADSEAELAGVIGHEVGHIQARHTAERIDRAKKKEKSNLLWSIGGALLGGAAGYGLGQLMCPKKDRQCLEQAAKYGAMAGGAGTLLIQKYQFMANSQEDEMEADRIGFKTAHNAGYHKDHIGKFYSKLLEMEKKHKKGGNKMLAAFADAMSTHPPSQKRVQQMVEMSSQTPLKKGKLISTNDFNYFKRTL